MSMKKGVALKVNRMSDLKPSMQIKVQFNSMDEIKELLLDIATLQEKYDIHLQVNVALGMNFSVDERPL